jgi:aryl-alcohol dehydrogenase-like predicted oxidoreductase
MTDRGVSHVPGTLPATPPGGTDQVDIPLRRLGRTELQVRALGLGGYQYTGEFGVPSSEARLLISDALDSGINLFDTAAMYGFGEGEELLGRVLRERTAENVNVVTKVGWLDRTIVRYEGGDAYLDESAILRCIEHSLWLLQRDHIAAVLVHEPDWHQWGIDLRTGEAPVVRVLERLKTEGVIGAIGLGGWDCDVIADLLETGRFDVALVAGGITLLDQPIRTRVMDVAREQDVGLVLGGALGQGALVGVDRQAAQAMIDNAQNRTDPLQGRKLLAVDDLIQSTGLSPVELAIRYILGVEEVHAHVAGARERSHLAANLTYAKCGPLPPAITEAIEAIASMV